MNDELWRVQLGTGEVRLMTLDGLDRAFEEGVIHGRTLVLPPGATTWTTLGAVAGLDDDDVGDTKPDLAPSLSPVALSNSTSNRPSPESTTPVTTTPELDLDLPDELELRPRRRGLAIAGIATALVTVAALTVVISKVGGTVPVDVKATNAVQAPPPAAAPLPPPDSTQDKAQDKLSEEQKKRLLEADKARDDKSRAKAQEKAEKAQKPQQRSRPAKNAPALLNGGDRFDPLNGQL